MSWWVWFLAVLIFFVGIILFVDFIGWLRDKAPEWVLEVLGLITASGVVATLIWVIAELGG